MDLSYNNLGVNKDSLKYLSKYLSKYLVNLESLKLNLRDN